MKPERGALVYLADDRGMPTQYTTVVHKRLEDLPEGRFLVLTRSGERLYVSQAQYGWVEVGRDL